MSRHSVPISSPRQKINDLRMFFYDTLFENSDGTAPSRRFVLLSTLLTGIITNLSAGTYFTGLMLAIGADEIYISYITIATTLCGFVQFASPLLLERMIRRKPFLLWMRSLYYFFDIPLLALIPIVPMAQELRLGCFMAAIILRNLFNAVSASGISVWQIQSVPPQKQTAYFTFSNLGGSVIGIVTAFLASRLVDTCEANAVCIGGISPTVLAILLLRACALMLVIPDMCFLLKIREYPYTKAENTAESRGLRLLLQPLTRKRFMLTVSIFFIWTFINSIIGEFFDVYLINYVNMSYTTISLAALISTPMILIMTPFWAFIINRFGWYRALSVSIAGYAFAFFFNVVITEQTQYFYFVVMILVYLFLPCMNIVFAYLPYINMPDTNRTAYISISALCTTLFSFAGNFFGNRFMYFTQGYELTLFGFTMTNYQYINLLQFGGALLLACYIVLTGKILSNQHEISNNRKEPCS